MLREQATQRLIEHLKSSPRKFIFLCKHIHFELKTIQFFPIKNQNKYHNSSVFLITTDYKFH